MGSCIQPSRNSAALESAQGFFLQIEMGRPVQKEILFPLISLGSQWRS